MALSRLLACCASVTALDAVGCRAGMILGGHFGLGPWADTAAVVDSAAAVAVAMAAAVVVAVAAVMAAAVVAGAAAVAAVVVAPVQRDHSARLASAPVPSLAESTSVHYHPEGRSYSHSSHIARYSETGAVDLDISHLEPSGGFGGRRRRGSAGWGRWEWED